MPAEGGSGMGGFRRTFTVCAAAGLASAVGCMSGVPPVADSGRSAPLIRGPVASKEEYPPGPAYLPPPGDLIAGQGPLPDTSSPPAATDTPLPINLATALQLAGGRPLDIQIAGQQVLAASAAFDRARLLWVPNLVIGTDYFAHTGPQQSFSGQIDSVDRDNFMAGLGPNVVFSFSDAIYAPLAARQDLRARQAVQQATINDVSTQVADAYFSVQQARGELAGGMMVERQAVELARRASALARGLAPPPEESRAKVELARRRQAVMTAREHWRVASAELARLLRLDPSAVVEPVEPAFLPVTVIDPTVGIDALIPIALTARPELAGQQAVVRATLARLKQEKIRPLVPSLALRSASTNPAGSLGYGVYGAGSNTPLGSFAGRFDIDAQLLWEFQALGLGNRAIVRERTAEYQAATLDLFRTQDRVAAEVVQAYAQVRAAAERLNEADPALREAIILVERSLEGLGQTRRVGDAILLVIRPQEAVASIQALAQANTDFFAAVADYNRAQFRLYRALGHPAQCLAGAVSHPNATASTPPSSHQLPPVVPLLPTSADLPADFPVPSVRPDSPAATDLAANAPPRTEVPVWSAIPLAQPAGEIPPAFLPSVEPQPD